MEGFSMVEVQQTTEAAERKRNHHPSPPVPPVLISIKTTAAALDCSAPEVYDAIREGRLRAKKMGRSTKVIYASVIELAARLPDHPLTPVAAPPSAVE
jgi:excisionase family DNA binding protein